jgi:uncharacterized protein (TIGR03067 family)
MKGCMLALTCLVAIGVIGRAQDNAAKKELQGLQGTWQLVSLKAGGIVFGDDFAQKIKVVIKADKFVIEGNAGFAKKYGKMTLVLDPAATPKIIDFKIEEGPEKGSTREGIYELKGDDFKLCVQLMTPDRPDAFETVEGSGRVLAAFKREK